MIVLGIKWNPRTGEYRVAWIELGHDDEGKAYYTDDAADAVDTLLSVFARTFGQGRPVSLSADRLTRQLLRRYRPD